METHISGFCHQCPLCSKTCKTRNALRVHTIRKHNQRSTAHSDTVTRVNPQVWIKVNICVDNMAFLRLQNWIWKVIVRHLQNKTNINWSNWVVGWWTTLSWVYPLGVSWVTPYWVALAWLVTLAYPSQLAQQAVGLLEKCEVLLIGLWSATHWVVKSKVVLCEWFKKFLCLWW